MGRRLLVFVAMALVVGSGVRRSLAGPEAPHAIPTAAPAPTPGAVLPPESPAGVPGLPAAAEPPPVPAPAEEPAAPPTEPTAPNEAERPSSAPGPLKKLPKLQPEPPIPGPAEAPPTSIDAQVERSDAHPPKAPPASKAPADGNPLPPAGEIPGQPATYATSEADRLVLPPERLPLGKQSIGLTVEVAGPPTLNLNQPTTLKIVVRNTGSADALGVVVRDVLPDGLELLGSQPNEQRAESLLFWNLNTVPASSERVITLRVKPTKTGAFDHAATVTMRSGSKSRTIVREPKLKVEQTISTTKVLKGEQVEFRISISNPGDGPTRNVTVQAKLSPGLRHESGEPNDQNLFEQTIGQLEPGQRVVLDPLVADTILGGAQYCRVAVHSPDVQPGAGDAESTQGVEVVEPKLELAIAGPDKRFADTVASYVITVKNPGTATARNVRVLATLPVSGRPVAVPSGARWDPAKGGLYWSLPQVEPGDKEKVMLSFQVHMGGIGLYQIAAAARGEGGLLAKETFSTDVTGMADVAFDVSERRRYLDVGETTTYQIKIQNHGSKEATRLLISAKLSDNLEAIETDNGNNQREQAQYNPADRELKFPQIDRLDRGKELTLGIKVKATKPGVASCRVFLMHDDFEAKIDDVAYTRVNVMRPQ